MRPHVLKAVAAFAIAILVGGLGYKLVAADLIAGSPPSQSARVACPQATSSATPVALPSPGAAPKTIPPNPDAGLSDAEREARYAQLWSEFEQRYTAWLNDLDISKLDLRSLPRGDIMADYEPGQPSLRGAVARADLIVVGTVSAIKPTPFSGTITTISVDQTFKGQSVSTVVVNQAGGLRPANQDWTGVTIAQGGNGAMLLPGDRAVLLLENDKRVGYYIQGFSGWYQVVCGLVHSNPGNAWGASVNGITEAAFVQQLQAALQ